MKKFFILLASVLVCATIMAQTPVGAWKIDGSEDGISLIGYYNFKSDGTVAIFANGSGLIPIEDGVSFQINFVMFTTDAIWSQDGKEIYITYTSNTPYMDGQVEIVCDNELVQMMVEAEIKKQYGHDLSTYFLKEIKKQFEVEMTGDHLIIKNTSNGLVLQDADDSNEVFYPLAR